MLNVPFYSLVAYFFIIITADQCHLYAFSGSWSKTSKLDLKTKTAPISLLLAKSLVNLAMW